MSNFDKVQQRLASLLLEIDAINSVHDGIKADDDQYEDPEEEWSRPLAKKLRLAFLEMEMNH